MQLDIYGLLMASQRVSAHGLMFSSRLIPPPNTRHCLLPETHAYYKPMMKTQYLLLKDTI
jgi:hypothetical protein